MDKRIGAVVATLVAGMFAASAFAADDDSGTRTKQTSTKVKCAGINECKGKGWLTKESEDACKDAGGTVIASRRSRRDKSRQE